MRKPDVEYIRYSTDGSAARQPEYVRQEQARKKQRRRVWVISVDPLAIGGILAGLVLLVLMITSCVTLHEEQLRLQQARETVQTLKAGNLELASAYESEIDLDQVRMKAEALGMIPAEEATHITIQVTPPVEEVVVEPTLWERVQAFFTGLLA